MGFSWYTALDVLYYAVLPFLWLFQVIVYVLATIALPFLRCGAFLLYLYNIPLQFLARFEAS